jgi:hypothetical protein
MSKSPLWLAFAALTTACEIRPTAPTILPPPAVPAVATVRPLEWDSRDELAAWVNNGASSGPASVAGEGNDAVIQVDVSQGLVRLHGPSFDPPVDGVRAARVRYRWLGRVSDATSEVLRVDVYLQPAGGPPGLAIPHLFFIPADLSKPPDESSGTWVDQQFTSHGTSRPPYSVEFPVVTIDGTGAYGPAHIHGTVEIDLIALIR